MEEDDVIHSPPPGWTKMRSRSFIADSHFYLRTITGEYKKTRWTELGVIQLREDLADALNYVEEMRNLIALLEKEEKFQKMPTTAPATYPPTSLTQSGPLPVRGENKDHIEKEDTVKEKRTKSKRGKRPTKDKSKKKHEKERGDIIDRLNTVLS